MTEKIEWYREVLELEPNSKVFFPLARLLATEKQYDSAIETLEKGLERHSEFLEARLFLIELLHSRGRKRECDAQVEKLGKMFASYAGFWQAWAACMSDENQSDTASVLRFLAAQFIGGPLPIHEVINRGVASILAEKGKLLDPPASDAGKANAQAEEALPAQGDGHGPDMERTAGPEQPEASTPDESAIPQENTRAARADQPAEPAEEAVADTENSAPAGDLPPVVLLGDPEEDNRKVEDAAAQAVATLAEMPEDLSQVDGQLAMADDAASAAEEPAALAAEENAAPDSGEAGELAADAETAMENAGMADEADAALDSELVDVVKSANDSVLASDQAREVPEEGPFSVRTRSMAEVLAEQGDIKGALDIYQELAAEAGNTAEADDIKKRIATLNSRLGIVPPTQETEAATVSKEKLIDILETLAHRVEERVNNPVEFS